MISGLVIQMHTRSIDRVCCCTNNCLRNEEEIKARVDEVHMQANSVLPVWYAVSWWTRRRTHFRQQQTAPFDSERVNPCLFFQQYSPLSGVRSSLFNSAHPIIRNLCETSSRLFLLPGTAVSRSEPGAWVHWLSCCYVLWSRCAGGGVRLGSGACTGMSLAERNNLKVQPL